MKKPKKGRHGIAQLEKIYGRMGRSKKMKTRKR